MSDDSITLSTKYEFSLLKSQIEGLFSSTLKKKKF